MATVTSQDRFALWHEFVRSGPSITLGYRTMGRIVYDSIFANQGWPAPTEPPLCGMYGHRKGTPRPQYIPCP
jgi:hypothetical protein